MRKLKIMCAICSEDFGTLHDTVDGAILTVASEGHTSTLVLNVAKARHMAKWLNEWADAQASDADEEVV